ncbi:transposase family protein [Heyndrickxia coagulans]|nr:transposase family protein [Heyndrickxia coagulans]
MTGLKSMRNMSESFNKEECIKNVGKVLGLDSLEELPHYDTINDFLSGLDVNELEKIRTYMIKELLKKRSLESYRIEGKYWGVIIDGTGLHTFHEKHCKHCLRRAYTNKETGETNVLYMHHVLEAKLVVGDMVFSIASEFIENESENVSKQDCELKAFDRLAKK